jgi:demethylmenaquinone methyltransferase/2-methoxy-6-polyprenyl-1,4-benzoquinol methylase
MTVETGKLPKLPGTRPTGTRTEGEASARVREMFSRIAPRYDFLNHALSFSLDKVWRRRTARKFRRVLRRTDARVLDLCCGTGDLTFAMEQVRVHEIRDRGAHRFPLIGSDFAQPMLERARRKAVKRSRSTVFATADALHLPFADASFDLVTSAFGFRNLVNYERGLKEIARVLKPGGEVGILEFSEPGLPHVGAAISGNSEAYTYLPGSVARFPVPKEITALMEKVGFTSVHTTSWNFRSVVLHSARLRKD